MIKAYGKMPIWKNTHQLKVDTKHKHDTEIYSIVVMALFKCVELYFTTSSLVHHY